MHALLAAALFADPTTWTAAPPHTAASIEHIGDAADPCRTYLARLKDAATALGYTLETGPSSMRGLAASVRLDADCDAGNVDVSLFEYRGPTASIEFSGDPDTGFALAVGVRYPGIGQVSQLARLDDIDSDPLQGVVQFSAAAGANQASVEFNLADATWTHDGDPARVNDKLAPTLGTSRVWRDIHVFAFALAGTPEAAKDGSIDSMLHLAIPSPGVFDVDQDEVNKRRVCTTAGYICTVAVVVHKLIPGCLTAYLGCLAAASCVKNDCAEDGETTTG